MTRLFFSMKLLVVCVFFSLAGIVSLNAAPMPEAQSSAVTQEKGEGQSGILEGQVLGRSKKAKVIGLQVGSEIKIVKYDEATVGVKSATKYKTVKVEYKADGKTILATKVTSALGDLPKGIGELEIDELVELVDFEPQESYVLIDVRSRQRYNTGHIPGALPLSTASIQKDENVLKRLAADKGKKLVFYSDGITCGLCTGAAQIAQKQGYTNVHVLNVGSDSWEEEGEMLAVSDDSLDTDSIIIDVRDKSLVANGHIPGAVSIPLDVLRGDEMEFDFPTDRNAPIVFYGDEKEVAEAVTLVEGWGFRRVRQVDGGFSGWQKRGQLPESGSAPGVEGISWQPKFTENQISRQEFKKIMDSSPDDTVIVDVRTDKEVNKGHIKSSLHVDLEDLAERLLEIPTDKKIITHCASGARAEIAALYLGQFRNDVRYLPAKVRCKGEKCRVR